MVATTRPETMLGDTGVAVHPDDPRFADLIGRHVVLSIVGRRIPIVADEYSDPEKGTGAVKITPAHDFNDFEVGKRHKLPAINVLTVEAAVNLRENEEFLEGVGESPMLSDTIEALHGLDRFAARQRVVEMMDAGGFLAKIEPHRHTVPHGDRGGVPIEPFLTDQWYVNAAELAKPAMRAVRDGLHAYGLLGQPQPGQPVPGRLHDDDLVAVQHGVAGLPEVGRQGGDLPGRRVVAAQRVVVRVADLDRAVRQGGDPERMLEQRLRCVPVAVPEVEQAGADGGVHDPVGVDPAQGGGLGAGGSRVLR